jgi:hypothetical protein
LQDISKIGFWGNIALSFSYQNAKFDGCNMPVTRFPAMPPVPSQVSDCSSHDVALQTCLLCAGKATICKNSKAPWIAHHDNAAGEMLALPPLMTTQGFDGETASHQIQCPRSSDECHLKRRGNMFFDRYESEDATDGTTRISSVDLDSQQAKTTSSTDRLYGKDRGRCKSNKQYTSYNSALRKPERVPSITSVALEQVSRMSKSAVAATSIELNTKNATSECTP